MSLPASLSLCLFLFISLLLISSVSCLTVDVDVDLDVSASDLDVTVDIQSNAKPSYHRSVASLSRHYTLSNLPIVESSPLSDPSIPPQAAHLIVDGDVASVSASSAASLRRGSFNLGIPDSLLASLVPSVASSIFSLRDRCAIPRDLSALTKQTGSLTGFCLPTIACARGTPIPSTCSKPRSQCCISTTDTVVLLPRTAEEWKVKFILWAQSHGKTYSSGEFNKRFQIFQDRATFIHNWNKNSSSEATMALNEFADRLAGELFTPSVEQPVITQAIGRPNTNTESLFDEAEVNFAAGNNEDLRTVDPATADRGKPAISCTRKGLKGSGLCLRINECQELSGVGIGPIGCETKQSAGVYHCCVDSKQAAELVRDPEFPPWVPAPEVDWNRAGKVTPVKSQRSCGNCYAFAAVAVLESWHAIQGNPLTSFSEQQYNTCSGRSSPCEGGISSSIFTFAIQNGMCSNTEIPYDPFGPDAANEAKCNCKRVMPVSRYQSSWTDALSSASMTRGGVGFIDIRTEKQLEDAVRKGPVAVIYHATNDEFTQFNGGILDPTSCAGGMGSHALAVVGFGRDAKSGKDYWIAKNSWGSGWGENGYIRFVKGKNVCGLMSFGAFQFISEPVFNRTAAEATKCNLSTKGSKPTGKCMPKDMCLQSGGRMAVKNNECPRQAAWTMNGGMACCGSKQDIEKLQKKGKLLGTLMG